MKEKDEDFEEIIHVNKISQSVIYISKEIRKRLNVKNGDRLSWVITHNIKDNEIILRNAKTTKDYDDIIDF